VSEVPIPFERGDLIYRTVYVPVVNGLDTFYTVYTTHYVKGAPIDLSRASWTIHSYSSHDTRGGASFRPPSNLLLDNNALWVNYIAGGPADPNASIPTGPGAPAPNYPHWAVIDMQEVKNGIEGFYIVQRWDPTGRLRTVRMYGSVDGVAFTEFGVYTLANVGGGTNGIAGKIYLDIEEPVNIRYFKLEGLSDHNNSANISLAGVGAFTR
ncbi:MAG TPA: discoidin domain-containing protein, partial [Sphingobacterium sp.]|nr:discoidin domain-containing protein [Sphingobacterium sp.]